MKKKIIALTITVLFLSPVLFAEAPCGPKMAGGHEGPRMERHCGENEEGPECGRFETRIKEALDLSDKQFEALEKLRIDLGKEAAKIKIEIEKKELDIKALMLEDDIDFKAIKKVLKEINDLDYQLKLNKLAHLEKASKILSKDQLAKFKNHFLRGDKGKHREEVRKKVKNRIKKVRKNNIN